MMRLAIIALLSLAGAAPLLARPEVAVGALPTSVEFGQSVTLPIVITREAGERIEALSLAEGPLETHGLAERVAETTLSDGRVREEWSLRAHAFDLGKFDLPPLTVRWATDSAASTVGATHASPEQTETIATDQSILVASALDPADPMTPSGLRGPFRMRVPFPTVAALCALGVLALGLLAAWLISRRKAPQEVRPKAPRISPLEAALSALEALEASDLIERGQHREWFYRLTDTVKGYFEDEFDFSAREMTSGELLHALRVAEFPHALCLDVEGWIGKCDLVKYARQDAGRELCRSAISLARAIVTEAHQHALAMGETSEAA